RAVADALFRINTLYQEFSRVRAEEWPQLQDLLCGYHQFVAHMLRDHQRYNDAIEHLDKALLLAESLNKDDLKALVLHRRGRTLENAGRIGEAVNDYKKARTYEQGLSSNFNGSIFLHAGLVEARAAQTEQAKKAAISLIDRVGNIVRT